MQHHTRPDPTSAESFPTDPSRLPEAGRPQLLELADGDTLDLEIAPVRCRPPRRGQYLPTMPGGAVGPLELTPVP